MNSNLLLKFFLGKWRFISELGVSIEHPEENELVRWFNKLAFISVLGCMAIVFIAWGMGFNPTYLAYSTLIAIVYALVIVFHSFGWVYFARYFMFFLSPIWSNFIYLFFGGYYAHSIVTLTALAMGIVAFRRKPKVRFYLLWYQVIIFLVVTTYVGLYGPLREVIDFPLDELVVFAGGICWMSALLYSFNKDRSKLLDDLIHKNAELESTKEELERFTYIASHDLKSPLRSIISFSELIDSKMKANEMEKVKSYLEIVKSSAEQMNYLVEDILEFTKLNVEPSSNYTHIDLNVVFEKVIYNLDEEIYQSKANVVKEGLSTIYGNEVDFILLFQNFIQNGIKYNVNKEPQVLVCQIEDEEYTHLIFKDNGIGIDEKYHEYIFEYFKRLHTNKEYSGTGLGLGLCKKIIDRYEGVIKVSSAKGEGAKFKLSFPKTNRAKVSS